MSTTITGEAPCYGGWRFLAALDELPGPGGVGTNWVLRCAPGVEDERVDRGMLVAGHCGHCRTVRANRRHTFLVEHVTTGELVQVGSSCLKDFTGWAGRCVFMSGSDLELDADPERTSWVDPAVTVEEVLAWAMAAVASDGFTSTSARYPGRAATADTVVAALFSHGADGQAARRHLEELPTAEEVADLVEVVLAALKEPYGYEGNLRAALTAGHVTAKQVGLLASAVVVHDRARGAIAAAQAARAAAAAKPAFAWLSSPGQKVELTGVITAAMTVDGYAYNSRQRMIVIEAGTTLAQTYTSARWAFEVSAGDTVTVTATVKEHAQYREQQQTKLTRVKRVS